MSEDKFAPPFERMERQHGTLADLSVAELRDLGYHALADQRETGDYRAVDDEGVVRLVRDTRVTELDPIEVKPKVSKAKQRWDDSINDADMLTKDALEAINEAVENWNIIAPGHPHGKIATLIRNFRVDIEERKRLG